MNRRRAHRRRTAWVAVGGILLLTVAGCGGSTSVSGTVTYDGQPVQDGAITFLPGDGQGPGVGGPISDGVYRIGEITPGEKVVQIIGVKAIPFATTTAELQKQAEEARSRGQVAAPVERADTVPDNAQGNNATVEIQPGSQTLDFDLKPPAS